MSGYQSSGTRFFSKFHPASDYCLARARARPRRRRRRRRLCALYSFFLSFFSFPSFFFLKFFFFFRNSFCLFFLYSLRVVHKRLITRTQSLFPAPPPSSRAPSESLKSWLCLLVSFFCFVFRIPKKKKKSRRTHTHIQEEKKNRYQKARNTLVVVFQNNFVSKKNNNENENSNISHCLRLFSNLERQASSNGL